jgi:hypothetical protein
VHSTIPYRTVQLEKTRSFFNRFNKLLCHKYFISDEKYSTPQRKVSAVDEFFFKIYKDSFHNLVQADISISL